MNLKCPKCNKWFELESQCSRTNKFDVSGNIACSKCGSVISAAEMVGEARWSEFCDWVIKYNTREATCGKLDKALWEVQVYDRSLRNVLVAEGILKDTISDPSIRLVVRSATQPDKTFILAKFKEYLNIKYERGFIDPIIHIQFISLADKDMYFDL